MMKYYIAYGSNMNLEQMKHRCPTAELLGKAELDGYSLAFHGMSGNAVATIEKKTDASVPVVIWSIGEADEQALDMYEGFPKLYKKDRVSVFLDSNKISGMIYVMDERFQTAIPCEHYFNVIMDGYTDNGIDTKPLFAALYRAQVELSDKTSSNNHLGLMS